MKWVLVVILIFVIMLIAYSVSEQYKDKCDFYLNLKLFLNQFKINLAFRQEKVTEFLDKVDCKKQFKLFVDSYKEFLKTDNLNLDKIRVLDDADKEELKNIVTNIGKHDAKNEIAQLDSFLLDIEQKFQLAQSDRNKMCPMILKLSLLFAIGLAILLI